MGSYAFAKMQALGNDFAVFYGKSEQLACIYEKISDFSDRRTGIGFDQLLFIVKKQTLSFTLHIFNADGSKASQCLNGARCAARFLFEKGLVGKPEFSIETLAGAMRVNAEDFSAIRLSIENTAEYSDFETSLPYLFTKVIFGNIHLITQSNTEQVRTLDLKPLVSFANKVGANLGFVQCLSSQEICLKTIERGSGETSACASNALAAVALGLEEGWLKSPVTVNFPLGALSVVLNEDKKQFVLIGPAEHVYDGRIRY